LHKVANGQTNRQTNKQQRLHISLAQVTTESGKQNRPLWVQDLRVTWSRESVQRVKL